MLHLFNKVYLEFDDKIEINFDRVIISEQYGTKMLEALDKVAQGELLAFGKSYKEVVGSDFVGFISSLKDFSANTNKRLVVYCDKESYKTLIAKWFAVILPALTIKEFKNIVNYTVYNQRITSNTQLSSVHSINLTSLWDGIGDVETYWKAAKSLKDSELDAFKQLGLNYSYEFLLANELAGAENYTTELRKTMHMFLRRWFKEMFADNRQMVLLNLSNHKFLSTFNIDQGLVDITSLDPLASIEVFESYADDEIWERDQNAYGICKLEGLSEEKALKLVDTFIKVHEDFEGISVDRSVYGLRPFVVTVTKEGFTDEEFTSLLDYFVNNPFDTIGVPRFDFQNVNFPLIQYFLAQKFNGKDLSKYRLV